jgi:hypothetical protein
MPAALCSEDAAGDAKGKAKDVAGDAKVCHGINEDKALVCKRVSNLPYLT